VVPDSLSSGIPVCPDRLGHDLSVQFNGQLQEAFLGSDRSNRRKLLFHHCWRNRPAQARTLSALLSVWADVLLEVELAVCELLSTEPP